MKRFKTLRLIDGIEEIHFNKGVDIWLSGIPYNSYTLKDSVDVINKYGMDEIKIKFRTHETYIEGDKKKYIRRVKKYTGYKFVSMENQVIDGYVFDMTFIITMKRIKE